MSPLLKIFAKFRLKLKKVGKIIKPFRYNPNQIPYDDAVEVINRYKGLDMVDRVLEEQWTEVHSFVLRIVGKKCKKAKRFCEDALQTGDKRREMKSKGKKERYTQLKAEFQKITSRHNKAILFDQCKEIEGNNRMGKTRDLFKKIRAIKEKFHAKIGMIKGRNGKHLTQAEDIKKCQESIEEL